MWVLRLPSNGYLLWQEFILKDLLLGIQSKQNNCSQLFPVELVYRPRRWRLTAQPETQKALICQVSSYWPSLWLYSAMACCYDLSELCYLFTLLFTLLQLDRALRSVFHGFSLLKAAPIYLILLLYSVTNGPSATHFAYISKGCSQSLQHTIQPY